MDEEKVFLIRVRDIGESIDEEKIKEDEMLSLLSTLSLSVVSSVCYTVKEENPLFYIGKGQAVEVSSYIDYYKATEVVFDAFLSPKEEMNLERLFGVPVSDREAVIQSIFFQNAHTKEARLQLERAEAEYQKPRLIFREANLSQQRGGVRGAKGEGEKVLELERRGIEERIKKLDKEIEKLKKTRKTQRNKRENSGVYRFSLLGYTNSGKTSLLSSLTNSTLKGEDKLFATLDTTTRSLTLPSGKKVLLSDTVGFIRNLPPSLIKAFSSTLEEALSSDGLLLLVDISHPDALKCLDVTIKTLEELNAKDKIKLLIINKMDLEHDAFTLKTIENKGYDYTEISTKTGEGVNILLEKLEKIATEDDITLTLSLPYSSPFLNHLSKEGSIITTDYKEESIIVECRVRKQDLNKYKDFII